MLNPSKVGTTYPSYRYEVAREKIREYAVSLGETDPRYMSDDEDCVAPPTFVACFTVAGARPPFSDPDLGAHPNLLHGAQAFIFGERLLRPGDVVVCTPKIAEIVSRGPGEILIVEVDCRFSDTGERAVLSRSTIVFRDGPQGGAGGETSDDPDKEPV